MEKSELYNKLDEFEKDSFHTLRWDRGNGALERTVRFGGFDENKKPLLYFEGETCLDIEKIGGYDSITFLD